MYSYEVKSLKQSGGIKATRLDFLVRIGLAYEKLPRNMIIFCKKSILFLFMLPIIPWTQTVSQTVDDPIGDITAGDPGYVDIEKVKFWQSTGAPDRMTIDFYSNGVIPRGNQAGINATTIYEVYMDVDDNNATGVKLEDIGYDYKLHLNLFDWNGKNWIDGSVYWDYDALDSPRSQSGFFVFAEGNPRSTSPYRFRWLFSLIGLKWPQVSWIARTFYGNHWSDQVPDSGHASLEIDTTGVADIDTVRGEHIEFIYPTTFQEKLDNFEVLKAIDSGIQIEKLLCGTEFHGIQVVQFNPWIEGVAYSGNPVSIGSWMWEDPPWFIVFHELGHNFTMSAERFNILYPALGYDTPMDGDNWNFGTSFAEAWASMVGFYSMHELFTEREKYQLGIDCAGSLKQNFNDMKNSFTGQLEGYEENPNFHILNPDLLDGMFMSLGEEYGYDIFPYFFKMLQPPDEPWDILNEIKNNVTSDYNYAKTASMTVTCCAFSVAAGVDLRNQFVTKWDFPIDDLIYTQIKPEIEAMMTGVHENLALTDRMQFKLFPNYPNPFNASTSISYELNRQSVIIIRVYDLLGKLVKVVDEGTKAAGYHRLVWDASNISSGVYILSLETSQGAKATKCTLIR